MIKKIIFDLDNTLITWEDEKNWNKAYKELVQQYKITTEQFDKVKQIMNNYEVLEDIFCKETMQEMINKKLNKEYPIQFLQIILNTFAQCVPEQKNPDLYETLQYLSQKYELVVLTNWFTWEQGKRLEKYGISQYFTRIYGADSFKVKPNKESYDVAIGTNKKDECIMIGDGIKNDVEGAIKNGIQAILYNPNGLNQSKKDDYKVISNFRQLKSIL